jgi:hypothetical protein
LPGHTRTRVPPQPLRRRFAETGERRCTSEDAFKILTKVSQESNRKLRDIAQSLVDRAAEPSTL